jgi:hypothetical protein
MDDLIGRVKIFDGVFSGIILIKTKHDPSALSASCLPERLYS